MRRFSSIVVLVLLLATIAPQAGAEGRWCLSLAAGTSVSDLHGSALDAALFAQVDPTLGLGIETGFAYMNTQSPRPIHAFPVADGPGTIVGGLTDGITRNRGYYIGPAVKVGEAFYAVVSTGLYEFSDNSGTAIASRWGMSAGIGLSGRGRFEPRAEVRYRWVDDATLSASAFQITLGFHIR